MEKSDARMTRTTITAPSEVLAKAKALNLNVSRFCQDALAREVARLAAERWYADNKAAIDAYNERVLRDGPSLLGQRTW